MEMVPNSFGLFKYYDDELVSTGNRTRHAMTANQSHEDWKQRLTDDPSSRTPMRYATVVLDPDEGFYPGYRAYTERASVTRELIHHIRLVDDGTIVGLYQLWGDFDEVKGELEARSQVIQYDIAGTENGSVFVYEHTHATGATTSLLSLLQEFELVLDFPLEFTHDGALRVTVLGEGTALHRALAGASEIVEIHLEKTGEYRPEGRDLASLLTDRQHQILTIAMSKGYYEVPREAAISDIAEEAGLSKATVGEHLQKIEATILSQVVR